MSANAPDNFVLPPELLAAGRDFGPVDTYYPRGRRIGCLLFVCFMTVMGGLLFFYFGKRAYYNPYRLHDWKMALAFIGLMGIPLIVTGTSVGLYYKNATSMDAWTCPHGIAWRSHFHTGALRWEDIESFHHYVVDFYRHGRKIGTMYKLTIVPKYGGRKVKIREFIGGVAVLLKRIETEVIKHKLPAAQTLFQAGHDVPFGKLRINKEGLSIGGKKLAWAEVDGVEVANGQLTIRKKEKFFSWANINTGKIPNLAVFRALAEPVLNKPH